MSTTFSSAAMVRRMLLVGITALMALLAVSASTPDEAHAFRDPTVVTQSQEGWVKTRQLVVACLAMGQSCPNSMHQAWRWNGSSWSSVRIAGGIDVYVYPYSAPWHWIWTQRTGWLAIQNSSLTTGHSCRGPNCPIF